MCSDNCVVDLLIMLHNLAMKSIGNYILKSIIAEPISVALPAPPTVLCSLCVCSVPRWDCTFCFGFFGSGHLTLARKTTPGLAMSSHLLHCGRGWCRYLVFRQLSGESSSWHRAPGPPVGQALAGEALGRSRLELPGLCQS